MLCKMPPSPPVPFFGLFCCWFLSKMAFFSRLPQVKRGKLFLTIEKKPSCKRDGHERWKIRLDKASLWRLQNTCLHQPLFTEGKRRLRWSLLPKYPLHTFVILLLLLLLYQILPKTFPPHILCWGIVTESLLFMYKVLLWHI